MTCSYLLMVQDASRNNVASSDHTDKKEAASVAEQGVYCRAELREGRWSHDDEDDDEQLEQPVVSVSWLGSQGRLGTSTACGAGSRHQRRTETAKPRTQEKHDYRN